MRRQVTSERKRIEALVAQLAPNVPEMRVEWLDEKPSRLEALKSAGLLADGGKGKNGKGKGRELVLDEGRGDGKVGSQGKRTVWCDGGADGVRAYSRVAASSSSSSSSSSRLEAPIMPRSIEDYDLEDLDDDILLNEGQLTDLEDDEDGELAATPADEDEEQTARRRRRAERHWSYLLSLLRARQKRLEALTTASERLGIVRALMANKGGSSGRKIDARKQKITDAVAQGKMTKNGLALPGNESEDEEDVEGGRGKGRKEKVVFKWGKERKR